MKCPVHSDRDVVGYCIDCGAFGCDRCLIPKGKGDSLCLKCEKTREAAAKKGKKGLVSKLLGEKVPDRSSSAGRRPTFARSSVVRKGTAGRKLEVHFRKDRILKGTTYKLDHNSLGFYLVPVDGGEEQDRLFINFSEIKAIYFVRNFEGNIDAGDAAPVYAAEGNEVKVVFHDGEVIEGRTLHRFDPSCHRFFIVPTTGNPNIISVLVERSALKGLEMEGLKEGSFAEEEETLSVSETVKKGRAPLSQNESMGDLYFSMKNYDAALAEYEKVKEEYPDDKRLKLKLSVCNFNRGVNFIKSRKYVDAKAEFEKIGEDDPVYGKARKKIRKIEKILKEVERMGA